MGFAGAGTSPAQVAAEIAKVATNTTNILTDARALKLDNLDCATNKLTDARVLKLDDIVDLAAISEDATKLHNNLTVLKFYSSPLSERDLGAAAATKALNPVVIPNLSNRTILEAYAELYITTIFDTSGAMNETDAATHIQIDNVAAGGWVDAIAMPIRLIRLPANGYGHNVHVLGSYDLVGKVNFNDTMSFQWENAECVGASLYIAGIISCITIHCL